MALDEHLQKAGVDNDLIRRIMSVEYPHASRQPKQDTANFMAAAIRQCETDLDDETLNAVMFDRACCKGGFRLKNARQFAKSHPSSDMTEKLHDLGSVRYMGHPFLNRDGDIQINAVGEPDGRRMTCPCWRLGGFLPENGPMPLSYCRCCGGHFQFHYQVALGIPLRLKSVVSSMLNSEGELPCVFIFEILKPNLS